jgi:streptogramin lyase
VRFLTTLAIFFLANLLPAAQVDTIAGTGVSGTAGDNGPALAAQVGNPYGLTIGPDGALYVGEINTHRVRRIDMATGRITTVAGTGERGYSGDGGPATQAQLDEPYEVRFDAAGDLYFVEMKNAVIRKVDRSTGVISTVAGTGTHGFSGDGGPATSAQFNQPHSIAFDANGDLYVADIRNNRIRKIDMKTGVMSTFSGTGENVTSPDGSSIHGASFNEPRTMAFDEKGDMFLALRRGNAVYRIDMRSLTLHLIAGTGESGYEGDGGPAKNAKLSGPKGIAVSPDGGVYIADTESHTIRHIDQATGIITTVLGTGVRAEGSDGEPLQCGLARPHSVYVGNDGTVYVGDSENHRVRRLR